MSIALKLGSSGNLQQIGIGESLQADSFERLSDVGNLLVGALLDTGEELRLGSADSITRIMGSFRFETALATAGNHLLANGTDWISSSFIKDVLEAWGSFMQDPSGFPLAGTEGDTTLSAVEATRTLSITPTGASFDFYVKGVKFTKVGAQSIVWPNVTGAYFLYFDTTGVFQYTSSTAVLRQVIEGEGAFVALVLWNSSNAQAVFVTDERHGCHMPGAVHYYLHTTSGSKFVTGGRLQNITVDGAGSSNADAQLSAEPVGFRDEDIYHESATRPQVLSFPAQVPTYYRSGANGDLRKKVADTFPFIYSGTAGYAGASGRVPYNRWTGTTWDLAELGQGEIVLVHFFATGGISEIVLSVQGQNAYSTVSAARAGALTEISTLQDLFGSLVKEIIPLGTIIVQTSTAYTNTPHARIRSDATGAAYVDVRQTTLLGSATASTSTVFADSTFALFDDLDSTKRVVFQLANITTGTTRTITVPDANVTLGLDTTAIHKGTAAEFSAITTKTPVAADLILIEDSAASFAKKTSSFSSVSHTLLSNIGTNSHTTIDTHLGYTANNPHGTLYSQLGGATVGTANYLLRVNAAGNAVEAGLAVNASIATAANIAVTKLAAGTNNYVLRTSSSGTIEWALLTGTNLSPLAAILGSQLSAEAAIAPTQLSVGGLNTVIQGSSASGSQVWTATPTVTSLTTTTQVVAGTYIQAGTTPAVSGTIRVPSTHAFRVRNTGGTADLAILETSSANGNLYIGPSSASMGGTANNTYIQAYGGYLYVRIDGSARAHFTTEAFSPSTTGGITLGTSSLPWGTYYGSSSLIVDDTLHNLVIAPAIPPSMAGGNNYLFGRACGSALTSGIYNILMGAAAGDLLTTGTYNIGLGTYAIASIVSADSNTAVGAGSLRYVTGSDNTALGRGAGQGASGSTSYESVFIGKSTGLGVTTAHSLTLVGTYAGDAITTGIGSVAVGHSALGACTTGAYSVAVGYQAADAVTTAVGVTAFGSAAAGAHTTANYRTSIGYQAGLTGNFANATELGANALATADNQVVLGDASTYVVCGNIAPRTNATNGTSTAPWGIYYGSGVFLGFTAATNLFVTAAIPPSLSSGNSDIVIGSGAGAALTTGASDIFIGTSAGAATTTANNTTAIGVYALAVNVSGNSQVAVGNYALRYQTGEFNTALGTSAGRGNAAGASSSNSVFIGYNAGIALTTATELVLIGSGAGDAITTGSGTVAIGYNAGTALGSGNQNTLVGWSALAAATTGQYNVAIGYDVMSTAIDNDRCVAVGMQAAKNASGDNIIAIGYQAAMGSAAYTAQSFVAVGYQALFALDSATYVTAVGYLALTACTTGSGCSAFGYNALAALTTSTNSSAFGYNAFATGSYSNSTAIGANAQPIGSDQVWLGDASAVTYVTQLMYKTDNTVSFCDASHRPSVIYAANNVISTSDEREKQDIQEIDDALLNAWSEVSFVLYRWRKSVAEKSKKGIEARRHAGVIAQQIHRALAAQGIDAFAYGLLCFDKWDEECDAEGNVINPAGDRWSIRADQCLFVEAAYQRRTVRRLEQRLEILERKAA